MNAYVLVQTDGNTTPIAARLQALPGVVFAENVRGPYTFSRWRDPSKKDSRWRRSWPISASCPA